MTRPDGIEDLVAEFVERREGGESLSPEVFAAAHGSGPELLERLRAVVRVEGLFPGAATGATIGSWRILREVGRGGMGQVYAVRRDGEEVTYALKLLSPLLAVDARATGRFRREAEALRSLQHPGVARIREFGEHDGTPFLVMELVDGESLAAVVARARGEAPDGQAGHVGQVGAAPAERLRLPGEGSGEARVARLCAELCRTMTAAHAMGLVHRDLKPSNVILRADGSPVVVDFGLARQSGTPTLTATGDVLGTPHYMAPELACGRASDHRVDIYALGAMLYELVTGERPYDAAEATAVLGLVQRAPPPPPRRREPRVSAAMNAVVRRAMAAQPDHRFADAAAFARALDDLAARRPVPRLPLALRVHDLFCWHWRKLTAAALPLLLAPLLWLWDSRRRDQNTQHHAALLEQAVAARLAGDQDAVRRHGAELRAAKDLPLHRYFAAWQQATAAATESAVGPVAPDAAVAALALGDAAVAHGEFAAAVAHYGRALLAGAPPDLAGGLLGLAAAAAGDHDTAARELTAAARRYPDVGVLQQQLGEALAAMGNWTEAAAALSRATELLPDDHALWHRCAQVASKAGRGHEALAAVQRAIERAGQLSLAAELDVYLRTQAGVLNSLGDKEASIAAFRELVDRMPARAGLLYDLGFTYDGAHRFVEARDCYERALAIDPDHRASIGCLAWMLAGADLKCEKCRAFYAANPGFADRGRAMELALRALRIDRGRRPEFLAVALTIAQRSERTADLAAAVRQLMAEPDQDERTLGRLAKLMQKL